MKITRKALRPASKLMPGTYQAVIVNVTASPNYFPQDAFVVEYNVSHRGHGILYHETFINDIQNARTLAFLTFLRANGISTVCAETWIGMKLQLTFKRQYKSGRWFLNIYDRQLLNEEVQ